MQLFPSSIDSKLGFTRIKELIEAACTSELGRMQVASMIVESRFHVIQELLLATSEIKLQIATGEAFPEIRASNLSPELKKSQVIGYFMSAEHLFELRINLEIATESCKYFIKNQEQYPIWGLRAGEMDLPGALLSSLNKVFDKDGSIKDNASSRLKEIRREVKTKETKARKELDAVLKHAGEKGYMDSDSRLTIRDGRLVLPVLAEHKRRIKGLVVDESTTGKTVYIEPIQVFEHNNDIRELQFAENREIIAILTALTSQVAEAKSELLHIEKFLGLLDFSRAKAKTAIKLGAVMPDFSNTCDFKLVNAQHPILHLSHLASGVPVIPLNIEINDSQRVMVISGPNAGGKSVALKTVGLLQLMLQSGMLVPVDEQSSMGCFNEIFVDIGDEQSIESDLSTYSSHLANMNYLLSNCTDRSLFLIDEFGTGTEPQFGGAIAESILEALVDKHARGLITTHYGNLKKFAEQTKGVVNAAMRFDLEQLTPKYILDVGRPGSSFALEIAGKMGLPEKVLQQAREKIGHDPVVFEKLISELEQEKERLDQNNQDNEKLKSSLEEQRQQYHQRLTELKGKQKQIINDARIEAQSLLEQANQRIEATIRSIKESNAQKTKTHQVRKELSNFKKKIKPAKKVVQVPETVLPGPIKPGDLVRVKGSNAQGEVLNVTGENAEIAMGSLKSKLGLDRLQKVGKAQPVAAKKSKSNIDLQQKRAQYTTQLDVRGLRATQALEAVTTFIDEGILLGMTNLSILHGKGDGILRSTIRKHLQEEPSIVSIEDEHVERGGSGITLITLK